MYEHRTVTVNYRGLELVVQGIYTPGSPMVMYLRNGDPGYPEESADFDIENIELNGVEITDFFDGLEHVRMIDKKEYRDDCYTEIGYLCIDEIEGGDYGAPE